MVVRAKVGCDGKGGVKGGEEEGEGEEEGCHVFLFAELDHVGDRTRSWNARDDFIIKKKKEFIFVLLRPKAKKKQKMDLQNYF